MTPGDSNRPKAVDVKTDANVQVRNQEKFTGDPWVKDVKTDAKVQVGIAGKAADGDSKVNKVGKKCLDVC